jgi:glycerol-3-phosphate dehydrogenase
MPTRRADLMAQLAEDREYDLAVVGGGATGLGVALDAAARGLRVVLLESHDFAKGTSSRATKLVHGGVRYLAQGNISLVREALHERTTLLHNAPHLAQPLAFVVPAYQWWEAPFYGAGLTAYDLLAGKAGLGKTRFLGSTATAKALPTVRRDGLKGGVQYWDGQFNDARLALALARTAATRGALLVNYCAANGIQYEGGKISGLTAQDTLTGRTLRIRARCVVNAAGVWVDALREMDSEAHSAGGGRAIQPMVAPSQGVHIVVERSFLDSDTALMVPKTSDGRVLFAVPWLGKVILGTTDTPRHDLVREPLAFAEEVEFILSESARYLRKAPTRADIKSIWVGLRPLVRPQDDDGESTKALSREHTVIVSRSGLVTVTGGKWTTYRAMAEDVLEKCADKGLLERSPAGRTVDLRLVGAPLGPEFSPVPVAKAEGIHSYGSEGNLLQGLPGADAWLASGLSEAMVRFAARYEYAVTVEDMLARRSRVLFLDARLAAELAPRVAKILLQETGLNPKTEDFAQLAAQYLQIP